MSTARWPWRWRRNGRACSTTTEAGPAPQSTIGDLPAAGPGVAGRDSAEAGQSPNTAVLRNLLAGLRTGRLRAELAELFEVEEQVVEPGALLLALSAVQQEIGAAAVEPAKVAALVEQILPWIGSRLSLDHETAKLTRTAVGSRSGDPRWDRVRAEVIAGNEELSDRLTRLFGSTGPAALVRLPEGDPLAVLRVVVRATGSPRLGNVVDTLADYLESSAIAGPVAPAGVVQVHALRRQLADALGITADRIDRDRAVSLGLGATDLDRAPTYSDIAEVAGVSEAFVAEVLNRAEPLYTEPAQRVLVAARWLGCLDKFEDIVDPVYVVRRFWPPRFADGEFAPSRFREQPRKPAITGRIGVSWYVAERALRGIGDPALVRRAREAADALDYWYHPAGDRQQSPTGPATPDRPDGVPGTVRGPAHPGGAASGGIPGPTTAIDGAGEIGDLFGNRSRRGSRATYVPADAPMGVLAFNVDPNTGIPWGAPGPGSRNTDPANAGPQEDLSGAEEPQSEASPDAAAGQSEYGPTPWSGGPSGPHSGRSDIAGDAEKPEFGTQSPVLHGRIVTGEDTEPEAGQGTQDAGPFAYRPMLSDEEFDGLSIERKHEVALAELSSSALMFDSREEAVDYARRYWSEPFPQPVRDSLAWIKGVVSASPLGYQAAEPYLIGMEEPGSTPTDVAQHVRRVDETMHHRRSDRDFFITIPYLSDGSVGAGTIVNPGYSAADIGHIPSHRFDFVDLGTFRAPAGTRMLWVETVAGIPELALGRGFTRVVTRSFTDGDQEFQYGYLLPQTGEGLDKGKLASGSPTRPAVGGGDLTRELPPGPVAWSFASPFEEGERGRPAGRRRPDIWFAADPDLPSAAHAFGQRPRAGDEAVPETRSARSKASAEPRPSDTENPVDPSDGTQVVRAIRDRAGLPGAGPQPFHTPNDEAPGAGKAGRAAADTPQPGGNTSPRRPTSREIEVLTHVAAGRTDHEIAAAMGISTKAVQRHVNNIRRKFGPGTPRARLPMLVVRAAGLAPAELAVDGRDAPRAHPTASVPDGLPAQLPAVHMSGRETQILRMLLAGERPDDIATALSSTPATIRTHTRRILGKLGVSERGQLAAAVGAAGVDVSTSVERRVAEPRVGGNRSTTVVTPWSGRPAPGPAESGATGMTGRTEADTSAIQGDGGTAQGGPRSPRGGARDGESPKGTAAGSGWTPWSGLPQNAPTGSDPAASEAFTAELSGTRDSRPVAVTVSADSGEVALSFGEEPAASSGLLHSGRAATGPADAVTGYTRPSETPGPREPLQATGRPAAQQGHSFDSADGYSLGSAGEPATAVRASVDGPTEHAGPRDARAGEQSVPVGRRVPHGEVGHRNDCVPVAFEKLMQVQGRSDLVDLSGLVPVGAKGVSGRQIVEALRGKRPAGFADRAAVVQAVTDGGPNAAAVLFEEYRGSGMGHAVVVVNRGDRVVVLDGDAEVEFSEWAAGHTAPSRVWAVVVARGRILDTGDRQRAPLPLGSLFGRDPGFRDRPEQAGRFDADRAPPAGTPGKPAAGIPNHAAPAPDIETALGLPYRRHRDGRLWVPNPGRGVPEQALAFHHGRDHDDGDGEHGEESGGSGERPEIPRPGFLRRLRERMRPQNPQIARLYLGGTLSGIGGTAATSALPLIVNDLGGSIQLTGLTTSAVLAGGLLAQFPAGVAADRSDSRRIIQIGAGTALTVGGTAAAWTAAGLPGALWAVIGSAVVVKVADTFAGASRLVYGRELAANTEQRDGAINLSYVETQASGTVGNFLGPVLSRISPSLPFLANSLSYAADLVALFKLPSVRPGEKRAGVLDGARAMWRDLYLRGYTGISFAWGLGSAASGVHLANIVTTAGYSATTTGLIWAGGAAGVLVGMFTPKRVMNWLNVKGTHPVTLGLWSTLMAAYATTTDPWILGLGSVLTGAAVMVNNRKFSAHQADTVPSEVIGGAIASAGVVGGLGGVVGGVVGGKVLDSLGGTATGLMNAGLFGGAALISTGLALATRNKRTSAESNPDEPRLPPEVIENCAYHLSRTFWYVGNTDSPEPDGSDPGWVAEDNWRRVEATLRAELRPVTRQEGVDPVRAAAEAVRARKDGVDSMVVVVEGASGTHGWLVTNVKGNVLVFDTLIDKSDPEVPRVRDYDGDENGENKWQPTYLPEDIETVYTASFTLEDGVLVAKRPASRNPGRARAHSVHPRKIQGRPHRDDRAGDSGRVPPQNLPTGPTSSPSADRDPAGDDGPATGAAAQPSVRRSESGVSGPARMRDEVPPGDQEPAVGDADVSESVAGVAATVQRYFAWLEKDRQQVDLGSEEELAHHLQELRLKEALVEEVTLHPGGATARLLFPHVPPNAKLSFNSLTRLTQAVNQRALSGEEPAIARWYSLTGGRPARTPAEFQEMARDYFAAFEANETYVAEYMGRGTQVNDPARSRLLYPLEIFATVATGKPLRVLSVGACGLLDARAHLYRYKFRGKEFGDPDGRTLIGDRWDCPDSRVAGVRELLEVRPRVVEVAGCDLDPLSATDEDDINRLAAGFMGCEVGASRRILTASEDAKRGEPAHIDQESALTWLPRQLGRDRSGHATVVWDSMLRRYLTPEQNAELDAAIEAAGARATVDDPLIYAKYEIVEGKEALVIRTYLGDGVRQEFIVPTLLPNRTPGIDLAELFTTLGLSDGSSAPDSRVARRTPDGPVVGDDEPPAPVDAGNKASRVIESPAAVATDARAERAPESVGEGGNAAGSRAVDRRVRREDTDTSRRSRFSIPAAPAPDIENALDLSYRRHRDGRLWVPNPGRGVPGQALAFHHGPDHDGGGGERDGESGGQRRISGEPAEIPKPGFLRRFWDRARPDNSHIARLYTGATGSTVGALTLSSYVPLYVDQVSGSSQLTGWTSAAIAASGLLAQFPAGTVLNNRRAIQIGSAVGLGTTGVTAGWLLAGMPGALGVVIGSAVIVTVADTFANSSTLLYARGLAENKQQLQSAMKMRQVQLRVSGSVGKFAGPLLGAVSPALPFVANAATYAAYQRAMRKIPSVSAPPSAKRAGMLDGARFMWQDTYLRGRAILGFPWMFTVSSSGVQLANLINTAGYSPTTAGLLVSATSAGTLAGAFIPNRVLSRINMSAAHSGALALMGTLAAEYALAADPLLLWSTSLATGAAVMLSNTTFDVFQSEAVPIKVLGGAKAFNAVVGGIGAVVGGAVSGAVLEMAGGPAMGVMSVGIAGTAALVSAGLGWATRKKRVPEEPQTADEGEQPPDSGTTGSSPARDGGAAASRNPLKWWRCRPVERRDGTAPFPSGDDTGRRPTADSRDNDPAVPASAERIGGEAEDRASRPDPDSRARSGADTTRVAVTTNESETRWDCVARAADDYWAALGVPRPTDRADAGLDGVLLKDVAGVVGASWDPEIVSLEQATDRVARTGKPMIVVVVYAGSEGEAPQRGHAVNVKRLDDGSVVVHELGADKTGWSPAAPVAAVLGMRVAEGPRDNVVTELPAHAQDLAAVPIGFVPGLAALGPETFAKVDAAKQELAELAGYWYIPEVPMPEPGDVYGAEWVSNRGEWLSALFDGKFEKLREIELTEKDFLELGRVIERFPVYMTLALIVAAGLSVDQLIHIRKMGWGQLFIAQTKITRRGEGTASEGEETEGEGEKITVWKLRTMRKDNPLEPSSRKNKDKTTPLSRFARDTSLDELPQLLAIAAGTMQYFSGRPLLDGDLERMEEQLTPEEYAFWVDHLKDDLWSALHFPGCRAHDSASPEYLRARYLAAYIWSHIGSRAAEEYMMRIVDRYLASVVLREAPNALIGTVEDMLRGMADLLPGRAGQQLLDGADRVAGGPAKKIAQVIRGTANRLSDLVFPPPDSADAVDFERKKMLTAIAFVEPEVPEITASQPDAIDDADRDRPESAAKPDTSRHTAQDAAHRSGSETEVPDEESSIRPGATRKDRVHRSYTGFDIRDAADLPAHRVRRRAFTREPGHMGPEQGFHHHPDSPDPESWHTGRESPGDRGRGENPADPSNTPWSEQTVEASATAGGHAEERTDGDIDEPLYLVAPPPWGTRTADTGAAPDEVLDGDPDRPPFVTPPPDPAAGTGEVPEYLIADNAQVLAHPDLAELLLATEYRVRGTSDGTEMPPEHAAALRRFAMEHGEVHDGNNNRVHLFGHYAVRERKPGSDSTEDSWMADYQLWPHEYRTVEALVQTAIRLGLPHLVGRLPQILYVETDEDGNVLYEIHRRIYGRPVESLRSPDVRAMLAELTPLFVEIAVPQELLPLPENYPASGDSVGFFTMLVDQLETQYQSARRDSVIGPLLNELRFPESIAPGLAGLADLVRSQPFRLLHADITRGNVLGDGDNAAVLVDFGCALYGPPDYELAVLLQRNIELRAGAEGVFDIPLPFFLLLETQRVLNDLVRLVQHATGPDADTARAHVNGHYLSTALHTVEYLWDEGRFVAERALEIVGAILRAADELSVPAHPGEEPASWGKGPTSA